MNVMWQLIEQGGWVSYAIFVVNTLLFYVLGYRYYTSSTTDQFMHRVQSLEQIKLKDLQLALDLEKQNLRDYLSQYKKLSLALVTVAPLLGLLGTVIGMIETFDSMGRGELYSQTGGVAAGISQAMITTQMGLVVCVPGIIFSRWLNRRENLLVEQAEIFGQTIKNRIERSPS